MVNIMKWRKSSYSGSNSGNCVEMSDHDNRVLVRDTHDRTGPVLRFTADAWRRFAEQVKRPLAPANTVAWTSVFCAVLVLCGISRS